MNKLFLETAGSEVDYTFLFDKPSERWWIKYARKNIFERPSIIIEKLDYRQLRAYISAIPSERIDETRPATVFCRYNLAFELDIQDSKYTDFLLILVEIWLLEIKRANDNQPHHSQSQLTEKFDAKFTKPVTDSFLKAVKENTSTPDMKKDYENRINQVIDSLTEKEVNKQGSIKIKSWYGGIKNENNCNDWLNFVKELIFRKRQGGALLLNNLSSNSDSEAILEKNIFPTALLLSRSDKIRVYHRGNSEKMKRLWVVIIFILMGSAIITSSFWIKIFLSILADSSSSNITISKLTERTSKLEEKLIA